MTQHENIINPPELDDTCNKEFLHTNKNLLVELCTNNAEYFSKDSSESGQRLYICFLAIREVLESISPKYARIEEKAKNYDFDAETPGNGYRSFLFVVDKAIELSLQLNNRASSKRDSVLFRKTNMARDVESCSHLLASLDTILTHLETLMSWSSSDSLFPSEEHGITELLNFCEDVNQYCFYGRNIGFQFCDSLKNVLQFITLSMAIFSESYYSEGSIISKATNSVMSTTRYITDPEQRAIRIVNISRNAEVDFCKAFWFLAESEMMQSMPSIISPNVAISKVIHIPPEPLSLIVDGIEIEVPIPNAHIGRKSIQVRLICQDVREGMIGEGANKSKALPPSRGLLIHCHGGGFVAQSSKSHEAYLRDWAKHLKVPILSIDYSLAPECPFPRALEEITYAYCWALKNHDLIGSTGERIVTAGDSAGANLLLATTLKCINLKIPTPSGVFVAYVPTFVNCVASPARFLCMMDPLLPFGFLMRCLKAYACPDPTKMHQANQNGENSDTESFEEISESDLLELQAHKSPVSDTSDTLTFGSLSSNDDDADLKNNTKLDNVTTSDVEKTEKCVSDFLERYVLDSDTDTDGTKVPVLKQETSASSSSYDFSLPTKITTFVSNLRGKFASFVNSKQRTTDKLDNKSLVDEFNMVIPTDPYLSPFCASDDDLNKFPPVRVLTVQLDPCLDDCVMFSKRLKNLNRDVKLEILEGLPHGFLNFSLISKEAHEGSLKCVERIKELLNLEGLPDLQQASS